MGVDSEWQEEFVSFYRAHWPRLVAVLRSTLPPGEDAADVAQEAFARAWQHWDKVRVHEHPEAWVALTAQRLVGGLWRRLAVRRRKEPAVLAVAASTQKDERSSLTELLAPLSPRQRAAVLLRHYYGLSTKETARALRCREGTVKSMLHRAHVTLASVGSGEGET
jgi:RNA polymerase sigma-70 factor (ECF subfamily)